MTLPSIQFHGTFLPRRYTFPSITMPKDQCPKIPKFHVLFVICMGYFLAFFSAFFSRFTSASRSHLPNKRLWQMDQSGWWYSLMYALTQIEPWSSTYGYQLQGIRENDGHRRPERNGIIKTQSSTRESNVLTSPSTSCDFRGRQCRNFQSGFAPPSLQRFSVTW